MTLAEQVDNHEQRLVTLEDWAIERDQERMLPQWANGIDFLAGKYVTRTRILAAAGTLLTVVTMFYGLFRGVPGV